MTRGGRNQVNELNEEKKTGPVKLGQKIKCFNFYERDLVIQQDLWIVNCEISVEIILMNWYCI